MTPSFDPARPGATPALFRPARYIMTASQGSTITILDLDHGIVYATTPQGAEAWNTLVNGARLPRTAPAEGVDGQESRHPWARVAAYLFDRRIIEPVTR